jgi:uncharacterized repeat protein (TIGR03803 family)
VVSLAAIVCSFLAGQSQVQAQTYSRLYSFCSSARCADGLYPQAGLIEDSSGDFYGTTSEGGAHGQGAVFKLGAGGGETVLYSFCAKSRCTDGKRPLAGLIADKSGNLYGTTYSGGAHAGGTIFKLAPNGAETVLHSFCSQKSCVDGAKPLGALVLDSSGNLYGTTDYGGRYNYGTVFRVEPNGTEAVLHSFCNQDNCADGVYPQAGLILDNSGNLYGTAVEGGRNGYGVAFKLAPDRTETVLYSFCAQDNCTDGAEPGAGLVADGSGNLYGTTYYGGSSGYGAAFKLAANGTETVLHSFCSEGHCADGANPLAGLVRDSAGNLYGTTEDGGEKARCCGVAFKLATSGSETVLHTFCFEKGCDDGAYPLAGLFADGSGNLYSTTVQGGGNNGGAVFKLSLTR